MTKGRLCTQLRCEKKDILYLYPAVGEIEIDMRMRGGLHHFRQRIALQTGRTSQYGARSTEQQVLKRKTAIGIEKTGLETREPKPGLLGQFAGDDPAAGRIGVICQTRAVRESLSR